jgi:hypothetical protein
LPLPDLERAARRGSLPEARASTLVRAVVPVAVPVSAAVTIAMALAALRRVVVVALHIAPLSIAIGRHH